MIVGRNDAIAICPGLVGLYSFTELPATEDAAF